MRSRDYWKGRFDKLEAARAAALAKETGVSRTQAGQLVMTESAYFGNLGMKDGFDELGVEEFQVLETFDRATCNLCGKFDGEHFPMSKFEVGATAPPFHPNCRGCICSWFEDETGERFARDAKDKATEVPGDMTFSEWREKFVEKSLHSGAERGILISGGTRNMVAGAFERIEKDLPSLKENIKFYTVSSPEYDVSREGDPKGVHSGYAELNARQKELLGQLPNAGDWLALSSSGVNMKDLAAMTAKTKTEFALFEKGQSQLITRGSADGQIKIRADTIKEMADSGYKWKGHTHPDNTLYPSDGDLDILELFNQEKSDIYNIKGELGVFYNPKYTE